MEYDKDKVDEMTMALLYLVSSPDEAVGGARAWKGFDWETLERLREKGWISELKSKSLSLRVTEEGFRKSERLFLKFFGKK